MSNIKRFFRYGIILFCLASLCASAVQSKLDVTDSPSSPSLSTSKNRAVPITKPGLPNLFKVTEDLYRGAQPTPEGFRQLKAMGIKTIINLRSLHSDLPLMGSLGFYYNSIPTNAWDVDEEEIVQFLSIATDQNRTPVFVHCQHGSDRTGVMCAVYRMAVCGWNKDEAIEEMTNGGFGFHKVWKNLILRVKNLDMERIKFKAGLPHAQSRRQFYNNRHGR